MRKLSLFLCFWLIAIASNAGASIVDTPHNETFNITCGDCHTYSLWWQYSPSPPGTSAYQTNTSTICLNCHDGSIPAIPEMQPHSSAVLGTKHGVWQTGCVDCHDPHQQDQLVWKGSDASSLFLVSGSIQSVIPDTPQAGETTIIYSSGYTVNDSNWNTPESTDPQVLTWTKKNKTSPDRSLLFVHDTTNASNTYAIVSVDSAANTIVLNGILDPASVNIVTGPTSDTFGLVYGQLIKSEIDTPNSGLATVKFFAPQGGFVDINSPPPDSVRSAIPKPSDLPMMELAPSTATPPT